MKIDGDDTEKFLVYLDGELFNSPNRIIFSADTNLGIIKYILTTDHFPYWPTIEQGEVKLEKLNNV